MRQRVSLTFPSFLAALAVLVLGSTLCGALQAQSVSTLIAQGDSLLKADKANKALDVYERAVKVEQSARTYLARARAYYMMERMDHFLMDVDKALRSDSTSSEAHYQRALYALRADDLARTEHHATKALNYAKDPRSRSKALILRGEARAEMKRPDQAILDLENGLAQGMSDPAAMTTLARLYDLKGRNKDALALLEKLCELEPDHVGHWSNRGFELIMLDRFEEALVMIERALALDKDEPVALSNRAYVQLKQGRTKEAWSDVERSLRSYPANPYALRTRAMLYLEEGELDKACSDLQLAKVMADIPEVDRLLNEKCSSRKGGQRK